MSKGFKVQIEIDHFVVPQFKFSVQNDDSLLNTAIVKMNFPCNLFKSNKRIIIIICIYGRFYWLFALKCAYIKRRKLKIVYLSYSKLFCRRCFGERLQTLLYGKLLLLLFCHTAEQRALNGDQLGVG